LLSNDTGIRMQTQTPMTGNCNVRRWDGLRFHDIHTKIHKDWFRHSDVDAGGGGGLTETNKLKWL
jgi:hypothetical protein